MHYDTTSSLNVGLAYSLREKMYFNWRPSNKITYGLKQLAYHFLSIFITKGINQKYKFN